MRWEGVASDSCWFFNFFNPSCVLNVQWGKKCATSYPYVLRTVEYKNGHARRNEKWTTSETSYNDPIIIWMAPYFRKNYCYMLVPLLIWHWLRYLIICTFSSFWWYHWICICFLKHDTNFKISADILLIFSPSPLTFLLDSFIVYNYAILGYSMIYG